MNLKVKHTVKQLVREANGKTRTVKTVFTTKNAAERYANAVGGTVEDPAKTTFGAALASAIMTASAKV
jgi:hypothetical protein